MTTISYHAYRRARQRLGWPRSATDRMFAQALVEGKELPNFGKCRQLYHNGAVFVLNPTEEWVLTVLKPGSGRLAMCGIHD